MNHTSRLLSLLALVAFGGIALHAEAPAPVTAVIPSAFNERRQPKPEELAEGTPLAQAYKIIKAIKADYAMMQANPKSKGDLNSIYEHMTPGLQAKFKKLSPFRSQSFYKNLAKVDLEKLPMYNILLSGPDFFVTSFHFSRTDSGIQSQTFLFKNVNGKWLQCSFEEMPESYQKTH